MNLFCCLCVYIYILYHYGVMEYYVFVYIYICECDYVNVYMQHSCNYISYSPRTGVIMAHISLLHAFADGFPLLQGVHPYHMYMHNLLYICSI